MPRNQGDRVGVILGADEHEMRFVGYGVYDGDHVPPPGISMWGVDLHDIEHPNPRLVLDDGQVAWGCEVWWGDEEAIRARVAQHPNVVMVRMDDARAAAVKP